MIYISNDYMTNFNKSNNFFSCVYINSLEMNMTREHLRRGNIEKHIVVDKEKEYKLFKINRIFFSFCLAILR